MTWLGLWVLQSTTVGEDTVEGPIVVHGSRSKNQPLIHNSADKNQRAKTESEVISMTSPDSVIHRGHMWRCMNLWGLLYSTHSNGLSDGGGST